MSRQPCDTCAFREGSVTFEKEIYNRFRAKVAAIAGVPFYCHHGINHKVPTGIIAGQMFDVDGNFTKLQACEGWKREVRQHVTPKTKRRLFRRELGRDCLEHLRAAVGETDPEAKRELWDEVRRLFRMLMKEAGIKTRLKPGKMS